MSAPDNELPSCSAQMAAAVMQPLTADEDMRACRATAAT